MFQHQCASCSRNNPGGLLAPAPVHQELDKDHEDADEHGEPHQDEAPAEHGEAVGLGLHLLV